ncbi:NAD(P)/FAD-dependent oxidoreductase [Mycobacterium sp. pUA109]|uniref:NAD(P)/FAD-dependent oxidoreductase n=1 Tax=Mycobacterium sp. pUA109 TaxID=3238982 RepID=UPI00351AFF5F
MQKFDAVIVGARCAGAPLATFLARQGFSVCVVDKTHLSNEVPSTNAFQTNGVDVLRRLGVLENLIASGATVIKRVTVGSTRESFSFEPDPDGYGTLIGIRRATMDPILAEAASEAGADVRTVLSVDDVIIEHGRVRGVETRKGPIYADLVIGADGRNSVVAKSVGSREYLALPGGRLSSWAYYTSYDESAEAFLGVKGTTGYLGMPSDGCYLISVNTPMDRRRAFLAERRANFEAEVRRWPELYEVVRSGQQSGPIRIMSNWHSYFRESAGPGWVLVGDAGHFKDFSPGQGMSDAFRQAECLADHIGHGLNAGCIDTEMIQWWRWRDSDSWQMYWLACILGEPYIPTALGDALFGYAAVQPHFAERLTKVVNKQVKPLKAATPGQILPVGQRLLRGLAAHPAELRHGIRALASQISLGTKLALLQPHSPLASRRYQPRLRFRSVTNTRGPSTAQHDGPTARSVPTPLANPRC